MCWHCSEERTQLCPWIQYAFSNNISYAISHAILKRYVYLTLYTMYCISYVILHKKSVSCTMSYTQDVRCHTVGRTKSHTISYAKTYAIVLCRYDIVKIVWHLMQYCRVLPCFLPIARTISYTILGISLSNVVQWSWHFLFMGTHFVGLQVFLCCSAFEHRMCLSEWS